MVRKKGNRVQYAREARCVKQTYSHPFGDLLTQHLHRKHGLSQFKLAVAIQQEPSVISEMCQGRRLTGPRARMRVLAVIHWLLRQGALRGVAEANALIDAADMSALRSNELDELGLTQSADPAPGISMPDDAHPGPSAALWPTIPRQQTPFIGRARELAQVLQRIQDPDCKLLTLLGPGGIGKTRLSIAAALALPHLAFLDGVFFTQLASVDSFEGMIAAIAHATGLHFYTGAAADQQLLAFLQNKRALLILDNFDHLAGHAQFIAGMLKRARGLKLLATSREALRLQEEWVFDVAGMSLAAYEGQDGENADALQLFAQCARRVRTAFDISAEFEAAKRICELVDGMPLGIELAAAWLRTLPAARIAAEIERGLDVLNSRMQNADPRHHSLRAVFAHSWQRLSSAERDIVGQLAVFRGFQLDAAINVAYASLHDLAALVDKSFLTRTSHDRYQMHPLLGQFALEALRSDGERYDRAIQAHGQVLSQARDKPQSRGHHLRFMSKIDRNRCRI